MRKSSMIFKALMALVAFISIGFANSAYAWNYTGTGPWANVNYGFWTVHANGWGSQNDQSQTLYANSESNWASYVNYSGSGTKNYAHVQSQNISLDIDSNWITSSFNFSAPSGAIYDFMFDLWTANQQDELMVIQQATTTGFWGTQISWGETIAGRYYSSVWQASNGSNNVIIFVPGSGRTSGTEDLMAYFKWAKNRGLLHNNTVQSINLGVEVTSTNGWQQFTMNSFSASWGSNGGGSSSPNVTIQNKTTGLFIDGMGRSSNGNNAGQWSNSGSNNQKWTMETVGNNVKFKNVATGLYLDGMGRGGNGSIVGQYNSSGSWNQQWVVESYGNYKRIKNAATGLYIDGMYWNSNGSDLGQWSNGGSDAQQWTIK